MKKKDINEEYPSLEEMIGLTFNKPDSAIEEVLRLKIKDSVKTFNSLYAKGRNYTKHKNEEKLRDVIIDISQEISKKNFYSKLMGNMKKGMKVYVLHISGMLAQLTYEEFLNIINYPRSGDYLIVTFALNEKNAKRKIENIIKG
jgi:hypothetical protein